MAEGSLAIVPCVPVVKTVTRRGVAAMRTSKPAYGWPVWKFWSKAYVPGSDLFGFPFQVVFWCLRWVPAILAYTGLLYRLMGVGYVLQHPELFVRVFFGILDLVPSNASYASERMMSEFKGQLESRFR